MNGFFISVIGVLLAVLSASSHANTYLLDDCPLAPAVGAGPLGSIGCGAEAPGVTTISGLIGAPSPYLGSAAGGVLDGNLLEFVLGVVMPVTSPGVDYVASLSDNTKIPPAGPNPFGIDYEYNLYFSVDRGSKGAMGGAVRGQFDLNQQPGDVFFTHAKFLSPKEFIGPLSSNGGMLLSMVGGPGPADSILVIDESVLGLPLGAPALVSDSTILGPTIGRGTHNNVDGFDFTTTIASFGFTNKHVFQTVYPQASSTISRPTAEIYQIEQGFVPNFCPFSAPYATAATMGLVAGDVIDALVVFDDRHNSSGILPLACGATALSGRDTVLFSLAPGSPSLGTTLSPADVMFSDFSNFFAVYADAPSLGLLSNPGAVSPPGDNIDALEIRCSGDVNFDGATNFLDYSMFRDAFNSSMGDPNYNIFLDLSDDGIINFIDIARLRQNFGCFTG